MSRKGNCFENAPIERFWGLLKMNWFTTIESRRERRPRQQFRNTSRFFITANVGTNDLAMSARQNSQRDIGERLRLLDTRQSDLVRTPQGARRRLEEHTVPCTSIGKTGPIGIKRVHRILGHVRVLGQHRLPAGRQFERQFATGLLRAADDIEQGLI